jgi:hypothetical protein
MVREQRIVESRNGIRDYRCTCGRLLLRAHLTPGTKIEIRCWHRDCHKMNYIVREVCDESQLTRVEAEVSLSVI